MSEQCTWFNLGFDSQFFLHTKIFPWRNLVKAFKLQNTSNVAKFQVHEIFKYGFKITMVSLRAEWNRHPDFVKAQIGKSETQISNEI